MMLASIQKGAFHEMVKKEAVWRQSTRLLEAWSFLCLARFTMRQGRPSHTRAVTTGFIVQDVVYYFSPTQDCTVNISLCNTNATREPLDTVLFLLTDLHGDALANVSCNGDYCGRSSHMLVRADHPMNSRHEDAFEPQSLNHNALWMFNLLLSLK